MTEPISKAPRGRKTRKSVGVRDKLLIINKDPNKVYRLVNPDPARLYELQERGYEIEQMKDHVPAGLRTDSPLLTDNAIPVGGGQSHVLMSIDKEWYEEDQREKAAMADKLEEGLRPNTSDGQYGKLQLATTRKEPE